MKLALYLRQTVVAGIRENAHVARRWRFYTTRTGNCPVRDFIDGLSAVDQAAVARQMKAVQTDAPAARHMRGDLYEVRAWGDGQTYRVLFSEEGKRGTVLLALEAISKKTQQTPPATLQLAEKRLRDWRSRP